MGMMCTSLWILLFLQSPPFLSIQNSDPVSLRGLVEDRQLSWKSDPATGREIIEADGIRLVLSPGLKVALLNGVSLPLSSPPILQEGEVFVPPDLASRISTFAPVRAKKKDPVLLPASRVEKWFHVVIDPGHGGKHTGGQGGGMVEKEINLDVSLRLGKILQKMGGVVTYTRTRDRHFNSEVYDDLQHRVNVVNRKKPDVFVSIHVNYVPTPNAKGFEIWIRKDDRECRRLGEMIRKEFASSFRTSDRGLKDHKAMYILRKTRCPAVLVELGFISNPMEQAWLRDSGYRQRYAEAVARGVKKYLASGK